jgi:hypothetical protein
VTAQDDWQRWCDRFDKTHNGILRLFHDRAIWWTILVMFDANPAVARNGRFYKKYYRLRHPGEALGALTPLKSPGWIQLFQPAWMPPGFIMPDDLDFEPTAGA